MDDVYNNIGDYNSLRKRKNLIILDDMITDISTNKKFQAIIKDLYFRCRNLNISLVFIPQCYFSVPREVKLSSTRYLIRTSQLKEVNYIKSPLKMVMSLKNKIYKHMIAVSKSVYFDVLDDIVDKYNNTNHSHFKMKPLQIKSYSYAEYNVDYNAKDPKFKIDNLVRITKYKNLFAKGYAPNWSEEDFVIRKIKNTVP